MKPVYIFVGEKQKYLCSVGMGDISFKEVCISIGELSHADAKGRRVRSARDFTHGRILIPVPRKIWDSLWVFRVLSKDYDLGGISKFQTFTLTLDTQGALVRLDCQWTDDDVPIMADETETVTAELEFFAHPEFFDDFFDMWRAEKLARMEMKND